MSDKDDKADLAPTAPTAPTAQNTHRTRAQVRNDPTVAEVKRIAFEERKKQWIHEDEAA